MSATPEQMAERLRVAFDLHETGVEMKRLRLRREFPHESEAQISERLRSWLQDLEPRDLGPSLRAGTWPRQR